MPLVQPLPAHRGVVAGRWPSELALQVLVAETLLVQTEKHNLESVKTTDENYHWLEFYLTDSLSFPHVRDLLFLGISGVIAIFHWDRFYAYPNFV